MSAPVTETFVLIRCCGCAIAFYISETLYRLRKHDHATFFCPIGHGQSFKPETDDTDKDKTIAQLRETVQTLQQEAITLREVKNITENEPTNWRAKLGLK